MLRFKTKSSFYLVLFCWIFQDITQAGQIHVQGLDEIQQAADQFVILENQKNNSTWVADNVNNKELLPKCNVPLSAKWMPKNYGLSRKSIAVICQQIGDKDFKKWDIFVPVTKKRPK
ncbi:MAG: hypothetical protein ABL884_06430 [Methyloglobulus sp.]